MFPFFVLFQSAVPRKVLSPTKFHSFPLESRTIVSHNVAIYRFSLEKPTDYLGLPVGQHISVSATLPDGSKEVMRSYTPISSDHETGYFDLLVKSYPQGNISKHIAGLQVGESIRVRGPKGSMVYRPNMVRHMGMIAGGTGITPMLQIIKEIIRNRPRNGGTDTTSVDLIFANVEAKDILLKDDLDALASDDDAFNVHYVLNTPPENWNGEVGFVTPEMIQVSYSWWRPPPLNICYLRLRAIADLQSEILPFTCRRHQGPDLRPTAHGQRNEEIHAQSWI